MTFERQYFLFHIDFNIDTIVYVLNWLVDFNVCGRTSGEHVFSLSCRNGLFFDHFWVISTRFGLIIPFLKIGSPNIGGTLVEEIT